MGRSRTTRARAPSPGLPAADRVTTDYNILVFDANGTYQSSMSGTADNSDQPADRDPRDHAHREHVLQDHDLPHERRPTASLGGSSQPDRGHAPAVRAASDGGGFTGDFIGPDSVETYGHNCAANCSGVAAYTYDVIPDVNPTPGTTFLLIPTTSRPRWWNRFRPTGRCRFTSTRRQPAARPPTAAPARVCDGGRREHVVLPGDLG